MKSNFRKFYFLIILSIFFANKVFSLTFKNGEAQIDLINLKFNSGYFKQISAKEDYSYQPESTYIRSGSISQRFEIHHGDCGQDPGWSDCLNDRQRVERGYDTNLWKDQIVWYGFSVYLPQNFEAISPSNTILGQVKLVSYRQPLWNFYVSKDIFFFEANASFSKCDLIPTKDMLGKWTDIALGVDYSTDKGFLMGGYEKNYFYELWVNGNKVNCNLAGKPVLTKKMINETQRDRVDFHFDWGIYHSYVSKWLDKNKTKALNLEGFTDKHEDSGIVVSSKTNSPFEFDWGVEIPTQTVYYDEIRIGPTRQSVDVRILEKKLDFIPVD